MNKVVLSVDDDPLIRALMEKVCRSIGVECVPAAGVAEAIAALESRHIDLVVSDLEMPGERGLKIVEYVRAKKLGIPVIIFSGSLVGAEVERAVQAGADMVLHKPAGISTLISAIRDFLSAG